MSDIPGIKRLIIYGNCLCRIAGADGWRSACSKHVSGVAMGLITKGDKYAILTDILGDEDHLGDMDFKVTGTRDGICGVQMDIKVDGLKMEVMAQAWPGKKGRLHILDAMYKCIPAARGRCETTCAKNGEALHWQRIHWCCNRAPVVKVIQEIKEKQGTYINLEEVNNRGEKHLQCK